MRAWSRSTRDLTRRVRRVEHGRLHRHQHASPRHVPSGDRRGYFAGLGISGIGRHMERGGLEPNECRRSRRRRDLYPPNLHQIGRYRLTLDISSYVCARKVTSLYPEVAVVFAVRHKAQPYHIPLLLSPRVQYLSGQLTGKRSPLHIIPGLPPTEELRRGPDSPPVWHAGEE